MQTKVRWLAMKWKTSEWVYAVDQIQILAQMGNEFILPLAAGFPGQEQMVALDGREESRQVSDVFCGRRKAGRALEDNDTGVQGSSHLQCSGPGHMYLFRRAEETIASSLFGHDLKSGFAVGGAARFMGDQLPGFQSELEIGGGLLPPLQHCFQARRAVEGLLHLNQ